MRVLMTADAVGGVWSYAMTLCASLQSHAIDVTLATLGPRPTTAQTLAASKLSNVRLFASDYRLEWMPKGWRDQPAAGRWLMNLADAERADLLHLNGYALASMPWHRPALCVAHSCVSSWWPAVHGVAPPAEWDAYRDGVTQGLNDADHVIAPTNAFLARLRDCYDGSWPAGVIYNGMACTRVDAAEPRLPIVFACGRPWDAAKNMGVLDAAARELPWHVYLAGEPIGPDGSRFAGSSVRMLGALSSDEVKSWLQRASIFVHPAVYEPFGLAVVEAAAAGCALVLANISTLRELWNGAAEFFDPRDDRELRAKLDALIADPIRQRELGAAARERAARYSAQTMADRYCELYETLMDGSSSDAVDEGLARLAITLSGTAQPQGVRI